MESPARPASRLTYNIRYMMFIIATIAIGTTLLKPPPRPAPARPIPPNTLRPVATMLPDGTTVVSFEPVTPLAAPGDPVAPAPTPSPR